VLRRWLFNRRLARRNYDGFDAVIGFDLDGFLIPPLPIPRFACLKGVIADELRFESGLTRQSLQIQASWERQNVRNATEVIATSNHSRDRIIDYYGEVNKIVVVPEMIDLVRWRDLFLRVTAGEGQRLDPAGTIRLLTVCRFYPRKNLDVLLRAVSILNRSSRQCELRVVGNGPMGRKWRRLVRELSIDDSVVFVGDVSQEDLAAEYVRADMFCMPSKQEGFGIVLLEAMAAGLPIVATGATAIPEVVPHAVLVDGDRPEIWASAIAELGSNVTRMDEMRRRGVERVQSFDSVAVAKKLLQYILKQANERNMRPQPARLKRSELLCLG
jgi:glycosyltransferase involved in cell wall biosynthesis